ncbi:MAG: hypothetical protein FWF51_12545 [Chitinivibrionia bacterium]|nr:hypothetical protein [Chitinivibrionia bacterium]
MKTMILTAKSYAVLKPFEMMAKMVGISVEMPKENMALKDYEILAKESRIAAKKAGLEIDDINLAVKEVRKKSKK